MITLFLDTETTGLPLWKEPSDHPDQPHVIDLACELWDGNQLVDSLDTLVKPGAPIPDELVALHGVTTEMATEQGIEKADAVDRFMALIRRAELVVGHNVSFDIRMMRIEAARATGSKWDNPHPTFCTMRKATNHCRILKADPRFSEDWKWPRLGEAFQHFFGEEFVDAHRARPDCEAARRIYFHLKTLEN